MWSKDSKSQHSFISSFLSCTCYMRYPKISCNIFLKLIWETRDVSKGYWRFSGSQGGKEENDEPQARSWIELARPVNRRNAVQLRPIDQSAGAHCATPHIPANPGFSRSNQLTPPTHASIFLNSYIAWLRKWSAKSNKRWVCFAIWK